MAEARASTGRYRCGVDGSRSRAMEAPPVVVLAGRRWTRARLYGLPVIVALWAYSFASQAWRLGHELASAAHTLGLSSAGLLARLCVHAAPELTAVFLPLAACVALVRRGRADDLAAATLLPAAVALPLVACAPSREVCLRRCVR